MSFLDDKMLCQMTVMPNVLLCRVANKFSFWNSRTFGQQKLNMSKGTYDISPNTINPKTINPKVKTSKFITPNTISTNGS